MRPPTANGAATSLRAHVWAEARHFFSRADAQQFCWLWLLGHDGRVHAMRLDAARFADDHAAKSLLARLHATPDMPIPSAKRFGPAFPLPGAPVVPLPRWSVSWGHPLQQALRAFAAQLDGEVLEALGALEVPGPFFGSVANYNRLALLPPLIRAHRLQALREFPALVAPLLLDVFERPDMFGTDADEPAQCASRDADIAPVLDAMDRGRDLIGALAGHYQISRGLVRSPLFREPWANGCFEHVVLRLLDAIPAHARPRQRESVEGRLPALRALPLTIRNAADVAHMAGLFAGGWDATWSALEADSRSLRNELCDTRDFLRAALEQVERPEALANLDTETLARAWLARRGLRSLLAASRRWHAQPLAVLPHDDGLPEVVTPLFGRFECELGVATERTTKQALIDEGDAMHHCVGGYWRYSVTSPLRVVHLRTGDGASATASYICTYPNDEPRFELDELRGPCNDECAPPMQLLADRVEAMLNSEPLVPLRAQAFVEAAAARVSIEALQAQRRRRDTRPLDHTSRNELRQVLAWCVKYAVVVEPANVLLRSRIAGFGYAEGMHLIAQLTPGDDLQLVREPTNPYDPRAVRIDWRGYKLGYVARAENPPIAHALDAGAALAASIAYVDRENREWPQVEFEARRA